MKDEQPKTPAQHRSKSGFVGLVVIAGTAAGLLSLVNDGTREKIAANEAQREMRVVAEVLPRNASGTPSEQTNLLLKNVELLGGTAALPAYRATRDAAVVAVVLTAIAPDGYMAPIRLLISIDPDGEIVAVRPLQHRETPGLGDQIDPDKSAWLEQFSGLRRPPNKVGLALRRDGGDLDHISGATITSRAVANAVDKALVYFEENSATLLDSSTQP